MKIYICHQMKDKWLIQKEFPNDTIVTKIEEAELILFLNHFEISAVNYVNQKNQEDYQIPNLYISAEEMKIGHLRKRVDEFLGKVRIRERSRGYER